MAAAVVSLTAAAGTNPPNGEALVLDGRDPMSSRLAIINPAELGAPRGWSNGMLAQARSDCEQAGLTNVLLIHADASEYELPELVDGAIFSLSYAVMRDRKQTLRNVWRQLKPGGRMVMLDAKVLKGFLGRITHGLFSLILRLTVLGNPDVEALKDIRELTGQVEVQELQFGTYFIARAIKPISGAQPSSVVTEG